MIDLTDDAEPSPKRARYEVCQLSNLEASDDVVVCDNEAGSSRHARHDTPLMGEWEVLEDTTKVHALTAIACQFQKFEICLRCGLQSDNSDIVRLNTRSACRDARWFPGAVPSGIFLRTTYCATDRNLTK
jgi:hypothetical protein